MGVAPSKNSYESKPAGDAVNVIDSPAQISLSGSELVSVTTGYGFTDIVMGRVGAPTQPSVLVATTVTSVPSTSVLV